MITADTITDEQIRKIHEEAWKQYSDACRARGFSPYNGQKTVSSEDVRTARARCAEILNARDTVAP